MPVSLYYVRRLVFDTQPQSDVNFSREMSNLAVSPGGLKYRQKQPISFSFLVERKLHEEFA